jgi:hypothetical protein
MDRNRLAQLLGMMGSTHDGEVVNAARLAVRLVKEAGLTWPQVLEQNMDGVAVEAARVLLCENGLLQEEVRRLRARALQTPSSWRQPLDAAEQIEQALEWTARLTDWERGFITSIAVRWRLTERQRGRVD